MSKKSEWGIFKSSHVFLLEVRYGVSTLSELCDIFQMPKQNMRYYLKKLCVEGLLHQPDSGIYKITNYGKRICDQYERFRGKQLVRIENMHVSYTILGNYAELLKNYVWRRTKLRNNVKIYNSRVENHTVRIITSDSKRVLEVIVTKVLDVNLNDAYHNAIMEAEAVVTQIHWGCKTEFSEAWVSGQPEIAIPSPIASALLTTTGTSQIRTENAIMNRSKGRGADYEVRDLQEAQKIVDMPNALSRMEKRLENIELLVSMPKNSNIYQDLAGNLPKIYMEGM